jgi:hypothetical protein
MEGKLPPVSSRTTVVHGDSGLFGFELNSSEAAQPSAQRAQSALEVGALRTRQKRNSSIAGRKEKEAVRSRVPNSGKTRAAADIRQGPAADDREDGATAANAFQKHPMSA